MPVALKQTMTSLKISCQKIGHHLSTVNKCLSLCREWMPPSISKLSVLESHLLVGKHRQINQSPTFDKIKLEWKESCHTMTEHSLLSRGSSLEIGYPSSPMGWALKEDRRNVRFNEKVKAYLKGIFEAGERSGRKANALDISRNMRVCLDDDGGKMFAPEQCQITKSDIILLLKTFCASTYSK